MKIRKTIEYHFERIDTLRKEIEGCLQKYPRLKNNYSQSDWNEYWEGYRIYRNKHNWYLIPRYDELNRHIQDVNNWRMKNWIDYKVEIFCM